MNSFLFHPDCEREENLALTSYMPDTSPTSVLSYATPQVRKPPGPWLRRIAVGCGVLPLTVGLLDLLAWIATSKSITVDIGLGTLGIGSCLVVLGFTCALVYAVLQMNAGLPARGWLKTFLFICMLYATTFGAALGSVWLTTLIPPRNRITLTNSSDVPISSISLSIGSKSVDLGKLGPGDSLDYTWRSKMNFMAFSATFDGQSPIYGEIVQRYFASPIGLSIYLNIHPNRYTLDGRLETPSTQPAVDSHG